MFECSEWGGLKFIEIEIEIDFVFGVGLGDCDG